jgi:hypothetical protein
MRAIDIAFADAMKAVGATVGVVDQPKALAFANSHMTMDERCCGHGPDKDLAGGQRFDQKASNRHAW